MQTTALRSRASAKKAYDDSLKELKVLKAQVATLTQQINKPKNRYEKSAMEDNKIKLAGLQSELVTTQKEFQDAAEKLRVLRLQKIEDPPTAIAKVATTAPAPPAKSGQTISTPYTMSTRWQRAKGAEKERIKQELIAKGYASPENWRQRRARGIPMAFPKKPKPQISPVTAKIPAGGHNKVFRELGRVSRHTWKPAVKKLVDKNKMNFEQAVQFVYSHYLTAKAKADAEGGLGYNVDPKPFWAELRKRGIMDVQWESNQKRTGNSTIKVVLKEAQADSAKKKKSKKG